MSILINTEIVLSPEDITAAINNLTYDKIKDFIIGIDELISDWTFTEMMYKYFEKEMAKKNYEDVGD